MVLVIGLEPIRCLHRGILSPLRTAYFAIPAYLILKLSKHLEASPGIEPGVKVLQTSALPLGYDAISYYERKKNRKGKIIFFPFSSSPLPPLYYERKTKGKGIRNFSSFRILILPLFSLFVNICRKEILKKCNIFGREKPALQQGFLISFFYFFFQK